MSILWTWYDLQLLLEPGSSSDMASQCQSALASTHKTRLQIDDVRRALSRPGDEKKLARLEELLFMQEDIKRARKEFNDEELGGGDDF